MSKSVSDDDFMRSHEGLSRKEVNELSSNNSLNNLNFNALSDAKKHNRIAPDVYEARMAKVQAAIKRNRELYAKYQAEGKRRLRILDRKTA